MGFHVDIYELESGHIHVFPQGAAEGMIEFADSEVFAEFVARCQEFIENNRHAKRTMDWLTEQNHRFDQTIPDASHASFDEGGH